MKASFGTIFIKSCYLDARESKGPVIRCVVYLEVASEHYKKHDVGSNGLVMKMVSNVSVVVWSSGGESIGNSPLLSWDVYKRLVNGAGFPAILNFRVPKGVKCVRIFSSKLQNVVLCMSR
jgi:hypothetical protein